MINLKALSSNEINPDTNKGYLDEYKESLINREGELDILDQILQLNEQRKKLTTEREGKKAQQNKVGQDVARLKQAKEDTSQILKAMQALSAEVKGLDKKSEEVESQLNDLLLRVPNKCHKSVPVGKSEEDNVIIRKEGENPKFDFEPKEHWELGTDLDILDFERAGKVTGARFAFLKGTACQMERALIQFMMDLHSQKHSYTEMMPPFIVNEASLIGTGQLPKFKEDLFSLDGEGYFLIPTAEVPVTNYYRGEILNLEDLPRCFVSYTPCFRSEAGSYGKDTKGLIRQHQFNKVELVKFVEPETSYEEHEKLLANAEKVLQELEISYRVSLLCTGDIGFHSAKCYDIEAWLPGQNSYREISSCSNFEDFQARRANIRFRPEKGGKPRFLHTLNGSGLAVGRTLVAIMENYQREDGSIAVPKVLQPYMGGRQHL